MKKYKIAFAILFIIYLEFAFILNDMLKERLETRDKYIEKYNYILKLNQDVDILSETYELTEQLYTNQNKYKTLLEEKKDIESKIESETKNIEYMKNRINSFEN